MKDENGLHFLGWMILAHVIEGQWLSLAASTIACVYAFYGLYTVWRGRK